MKKLLAITLALVMVLSLSVTAFAADITQDSNPKTGNTTVTYTVDPSYTVTIPATVTLGQYAEVVIAKPRVAKGYEVVVRLTKTSSDNNSFTLTTQEGASLDYRIESGLNNIIYVGSVVARCGNYGETNHTQLKFEAPELAYVNYAGTYTGTVTFTVSVELAQTTG